MKRKILKRLLCAVLCTLLLISSAVIGFSANGESEAKKIEAVAHRGYSTAAPENTLAAFRLAGEKGYYGCEFDIHTTKDKVWVINHNSTVDAMTDGTGSISDMTYEEISKLKIDSGNNLEAYPNEKMPTIEEALKVCKEYSMHPVIEVKGCEVEDLESLAKILLGTDLPCGYTIISFTWEYLSKLRELLPEADIMMLASGVKDSHIEFCKEHNINGISFYYVTNIVSTVNKIKKAGLEMAVWTVDYVTPARILLSLGVNTITTNKLLPEDLDTSNLAPEQAVRDAFNDLTLIIKDLLKTAQSYIDSIFGNG